MDNDSTSDRRTYNEAQGSILYPEELYKGGSGYDR